MHSIETYSKYLHQLIKEGKFDNVLINFAENASNFSKEEIAENSFLVGDVLRSYREQGVPLNGFAFLKEYQVDISKLKDSYAANQYGWLLHSILKANEGISENSEDVVGASIDFLSQISFSDENNKLLISQLFGKVIGYEKRKRPVLIDNTLKLLKGINIKHEQIKSFIAADPYIVSGILDIFRKSNHVERAFGFLKFVGVNINANTPEQIINSYGWNLYARLKLEISDVDDEVADEPFDSLLVDFDEPDTVAQNGVHPTNETLNTITNCILLFSLTSDYSPFSRLFNLSLKAEKQKPNPNWGWMEGFLDLLKGAELSVTCDTVEFMKGGRPKTVELASDLETWHSYYSLALLKQKKFVECIEVSKSALFSIEKFHYNNDLWFARKIALSNKGLGNISQAINEMATIEARKSEWFIQKELAELYFENGDIDKAKIFASKGMLSFGDKEKKDGLFFLLGQIYQKVGDTLNAYRHFLLSYLIRTEQGWFIPNKLKVVLEQTFSNEVKYETSGALYRELLKIWKDNLGSDRSNGKRDYGKIIKLTPDKLIGVILGSSGERYFFHYNEFKSPKEKILVNVQVEFGTKPPKGDKPGMNWVAFDIRTKR